jgi:site-specific recombinase XerD
MPTALGYEQANGSRTCGTERVEERYPLHVVQQALGHVDPRSTPLYADLSDMQLRHELERHRR